MNEIQWFVHTCQREGLDAGLRALNARVPHRYTGVYRFEGDLMRNLVLVDKAGEARPEQLAAVPFQDSFCQYVLREGEFRTADTREDRRLDGHAYQGVLLSYHGVPVLDDAGELFGSLCHFDPENKELSDVEFATMQRVARVLPVFLRSRSAGLSLPAQ